MVLPDGLIYEGEIVNLRYDFTNQAGELIELTRDAFEEELPAQKGLDLHGGRLSHSMTR